MKQKYKAVITDYDNTLVGFHQTIKENLKEKIIGLKNKGLIFSIATGRSFTGIVKETCKILKLTAPQIVMGGAQIVNPVDESVLWEELIPAKDAHSIVDFLYSKSLYTVVETEDCDYSSDGKFVFFFRKNIPVKKIKDLPFEPIPKILVVAYMNNLNEKQILELEKKIKSDHPNLSVIKFLYDGKWGLDITSEKATKHTAVLEYMKLLNLKPQEVVGVGDNFNDYPLLSACGFKIAMADAPKELLEIADFVAPSEKNDGLLTVLNKFF
jgi:Cof subfamily protein (haloacid dehalogenase superfamily)